MSNSSLRNLKLRAKLFTPAILILKAVLNPDLKTRPIPKN